MSYFPGSVRQFPSDSYWKKKSSLRFSVPRSGTSGVKYVLGVSKPSQTGEKPVTISLTGRSASSASPLEARLSIYNGSSLVMGNAADSITSLNGSLELLNGSLLNLSGGSNRISLLGLIKSNQSSLLSGDGDDYFKSFSEVNGIKLEASTIYTGGGNDSIDSSSRSSRNGQYAASSDTSGIYLWQSTINTGDGNDVVTGLGMTGIVDGVPLSDSALSKGVGFLLYDSGSIDTGAGDDLINGGAIYFKGSSTSQVSTGSGNDIIDSPIFGNDLGRHVVDMGDGVDHLRLRSLVYEVSPVSGGFRIYRPGGGFDITVYGVEYVASPFGDWIPLAAGTLNLIS